MRLQMTSACERGRYSVTTAAIRFFGLSDPNARREPAPARIADRRVVELCVSFMDSSGL
jgi:hypothetical protein